MNAVNAMHRTAMTLRILDGQRAVATGANAGIGEGVAKGLAAAGAKVIINYVTAPDQAERVVNEIRQAGGEAIAIRADVSKEDQVQAMFQQAVEAWGSVDILV